MKIILKKFKNILGDVSIAICYMPNIINKSENWIFNQRLLTGWHSPTITDRAIRTVSSLLKIKYVESQKTREHPSAVLNVLPPSERLKWKYDVDFAKTLNETEFSFEN